MKKHLQYFFHVVFLICFFSTACIASEFMATLPNDFVLPAPESEYDKKLFKNLETVGWHNVHVNAEGKSPAFAFTIGHFYKSNHPEIIVIGLKPQISQQLLNIVAIKIAGGKEKLVPYKKYTDITEGLSITFIPVSLKYYGEYMGYANWVYGSMSKPYPALQMVWPDKAGIFPWEKAYDKRFLQLQPILGNRP